MNSNLKTGDTVVVIAGKDKGKIGKITASDSQKKYGYCRRCKHCTQAP